MAQRVKDLAVAWVCLIPGPGASTCQGEKKKKRKDVMLSYQSTGHGCGTNT